MSLSKKWILLVEDDIDLANALTEDMSKSEDLKVVLATTFSNAVLKLNNQRFSCLVFDLQLGKHSSFKLIQQLKNPKATKQLNSETPIILVSGFLQGEIVVNVANMVDGIIAKPFKSEDLVQKIFEVISSRQKESKIIDPKMSASKIKPAKFIHDLANIVTTMDLTMTRLLLHLNEIRALRELEVAQKINVQIKKIMTLVKKQRSNPPKE